MSHTDDIAAHLADLKTLKRIYDVANKEMQGEQNQLSASQDVRTMQWQLVEGAGKAFESLWWLLDRQGITAMWNKDKEEYEVLSRIDTANTSKE